MRYDEIFNESYTLTINSKHLSILRYALHINKITASSRPNS
jgi:hypothetical protein